MLDDQLKQYAESGVYPFHMPGHKRQPIGSLPLELDVTEIPGFDNLHDPKGCLRKIERRAAKLYRAERAFLLVNGATGGILAAVRALTKPGDKVIMARNCHLSVYNAVELCGLTPVYTEQLWVPETDICDRTHVFQIDRLLCEHPDVKLVIVTSPTYEGLCSDIERIAEACHNCGARLLVDESHGAHFPFSQAFPQPAITLGADVSVVSLHKTLPSPTQTALLLTSDPALELPLQQQLAVFQSSSPSYLLMNGIEQCLYYVQHHSFKEYTDLLKRFYKRTNKLRYLRVFVPEDGCLDDGEDFDHSKLVITTGSADVSGKQLAALLREQFLIETEAAAAYHVIAMTSVCDTQEGFDRLADALLEIDKGLSPVQRQLRMSQPALPERRFIPSEKYQYNSKTVSLREAEGMVSMETIFAYPPGVPLIVPGEVFGKETVRELRSLLRSGVDVLSTGKALPRLVTVADGI